MKKLIFSLIGLFTVCFLNAQSNMVIHQGNGSTLSLPLQSIDSVRFILLPAPVTKRIFQNNGNILSLNVSDIDSITYTIPNRNTLPTISSQAVTVLSSSSAFGGGSITADGGSAVTQRGVCWNISPNPTIANNLTYDGSGMGNFNSTILPLTPNTTYYLRAYATNANGTSYGNQISFVTNTANNSGSLPTISSDNIDFYKYFGLFSGGNITNDGGLAVSARGICWATGTTPNINHNRTNDGAGVGNFISRLDNLLPNTQYFVRAYATNDAGTAYGNSFAFNTSDFPELFTDTFKSITYCQLPFSGGIKVNINTIKYTHPIYDIGFNDAKIRFPKHISSSGYSEYGIVWSKTINPKISGNKKSIVEELIVQLPVNECGYSIVNGVISYYPKYILDSSITISNLEKGVEYFVRFYAKNSKGTIYSKNYNFNTLSGIPSVKINKINYITAKTAKIPFEITSTNGSVINKINVLYSQNKNTGFLYDDYSDNPPINQLLDWYLTKLKPSTKYYFKILFETNLGTSYSVTDSFITIPEFMYQAGQGVSFNGHKYKTILLGNGQEWFKENLKTSLYSNSDTLQNITNISDWNSSTKGAWTCYDNDTNYIRSNGKLYNYYAIENTNNVCPTGWRVPSQNDWDSLLRFINPELDKNCMNCWVGNQGIQLKSDAFTWTNNNYANNESGFTALPSGIQNGGFSGIDFITVFGTSTYDSNTDTFVVYFVRNDVLYIARSSVTKNYGISIRCIKN